MVHVRNKDIYKGALILQDIFEVSDIYVIKIGSSTLVDATGEVDTAYIQKLADDIAAFKEIGRAHV